MSEAPRVSVVIRNFNRAYCVCRAIDSALAQAFTGLEVVVVDDASTDGSAALVRATYGAQETRLRLVALQQNVGAGEAANVGVRAARAPLIAFLDSDDTWLPEFLQEMVAALERAPRAAMAFCDYIEVWDGLAQTRVMRCSPPADQREGMLLGGFIHSMTLTLMRAAVFDFVAPFEARYSVSHDFYTWLCIALEFEQPFVHVPRPLAHHHRSADGVTSSHERWLQEYCEALSRGYEHPAAAPYRSHMIDAQQRAALGIVARRTTGQWLRQTSGALISVLILVSDQGLESLRGAIESVEAQRYRNFEITVIDNAADDETCAWLSAGDLERWRHLRLNVRHGDGGAWNLGAAAADGELLAFLEAHDRWSPDYLQAQVQAHSYAAGAPLFAIADFELVQESGSRVAMSQDMLPPDSDLAAHLLRNPPMSMSVLTCRRERYLQSGGIKDILVAATALDLALRLLSMIDLVDGLPVYRRAPPVHVPRALATVQRGYDLNESESRRDDRAVNLVAVVDAYIDQVDPTLKLLRHELRDALQAHTERFYALSETDAAA